METELVERVARAIDRALTASLHGGSEADYCGDDWEDFIPEAKAAIAAIDESRSVSGWRDIETAPKDGTVVWVSSSTSLCPAYWAGKDKKYWRNWFKGCRYEYAALGTDCFLPEAIWFEPTHWQPLPAPPSPTKKE